MSLVSGGYLTTLQAPSVEWDDLHLIRLINQGSVEAFDLLVSRHSDRIYRLALRMLGNREDAEDIQQETFVCAYRSLRKFRGDSSFGTWVYSIAARLCLSRRRSNYRKPVKQLDSMADALQATQGDPVESLLSADSALRVQKTLNQLAPPDRLLIVLKYVEGLSHDEIASILGCSSESSRSRLTRAKRLFRERFERME